uniref:Uncharacterized mitochondrial protein AtMg00810-like n=1 Tax=Nicotiana tabacum TaxID=4097 RepID=A0A1S4ABK7_TOBAC|nr:PREDICTED: uncharacterized mitochondrial protein AtMg00810-like [Nicotiana tabacum]
MPSFRETCLRKSTCPCHRDLVARGRIRQDTHIVIILVYVDDLLITGSDIKLIQEAKHMLNNNFKIKDLGELKYFLGIEFARSFKGILMNQRKYALELISECSLGGGKPVITPLEQNQKLTCWSMTNYLNLTLIKRWKIEDLIRVQTLSQFMHALKDSHYEDALRVVKYVKSQPGLGLLMSSNKSRKITAFCDAN